MSEAPARHPDEWHIITCEFPPCVGGVSDYAYTMAAALGAVRPTHVWCPKGPQGAEPPRAPGVVVHVDLNRFSPLDLWRVGSQLNRHRAPRHLFVQWVPQGFGYRSINVWFAAWVAIRGWLRRDEVHLMVHEPFLPLSRNPILLSVAFLHRVMLGAACFGASHVWVSTGAWTDPIRRYVPRRVPIRWLPVPAPPVMPDTSGAAFRARDGAAGPVFGHFGTHSPLVTKLLTTTLDVVLQDPTVSVLLIGRGSADFRDQFLSGRPSAATRVRATGTLDASEIASAARSCDLLIQPYPDGVTSRRTSTLGLLALGCPVVTNQGRHTEAFWAASGAVELVSAADGRLIGEAALSLLENDRNRAALSANARLLYDERFHPRHGVAMLEASAWPQGEAEAPIAPTALTFESTGNRP